MLYVDSDITRTRGTEMIQWYDMTSGTRDVRLYTVVAVFIGSANIFPEYS
jgi:hypothetical protein